MTLLEFLTLCGCRPFIIHSQWIYVKLFSKIPILIGGYAMQHGEQPKFEGNVIGDTSLEEIPKMGEQAVRNDKQSKRKVEAPSKQENDGTKTEALRSDEVERMFQLHYDKLIQEIDKLVIVYRYPKTAVF